jgi:CHASE3 domain sensor protein
MSSRVLNRSRSSDLNHEPEQFATMNVGSTLFNRRIAQVGLVAIPLLIAIILFLVSRQMYFSQIRFVEQAWETNQVREYLNQIEADLDRMESNQREFSLTHDPNHVILFNFARSDIAIRLALLKSLGKDDPYIVGTLPRLESLLQARIELRQKIAVDEVGTTKNQEQPNSSPVSSDLGQSPNSLLHEMEESQSQAIQNRRHAYVSMFEEREALSALLLCTIAIVVIVSGIMLLRIHELHSIITICAWTQRVNYNGKWMRLEEFLWERFRIKVSHGISEEALEGVMGMLGKNLNVPNRGEKKTDKTATPKPPSEV